MRTQYETDIEAVGRKLKAASDRNGMLHVVPSGPLERLIAFCVLFFTAVVWGFGGILFLMAVLGGIAWLLLS